MNIKQERVTSIHTKNGSLPTADTAVAEAPAALSTPLPWWERYTARQVAAATFIVGLVAVAFALVIQLRSVILVCFVALVISAVIEPLVERLHDRGLRYGVILPFVYILLIALIIGLGWLLLPPLVLQVSDLSTKLPEAYTTFLAQVQQSPLEIVRRLGRALPRTLGASTPVASSDGTEISTLLMNTVTAVGGTAFTIVVTLLLSYYWVIYRRRAVQAFLLMLPSDRREAAGELWNAVEDKVGAFVRGQFILCLSILILSLVGYWIIGLPYTVVISLLAGILEAVPYIGPLLTGLIAVAVGLSVSPQTALLAIVVSMIIQQLESSLLVPRIMGRTVGVNPVVTLLALTGFSLLFGLLGALLAIPLAAILQLALDRLVLNATVEPAIAVPGRDRMSVLMYEVQELTKDVRSQFRQKEGDVDTETDQDEEELESILAGLNQLLQQETQTPS